MKKEIFAIGHSTHPMSEFIRILKGHGITLLVDIRTIPKSRHNPQFNQDNLKKSLRAKGIKYVHMKDLGGLRHSSKNSINNAWKNASFRGYADYMQKRVFASAVRKLMQLAKTAVVAIMCAEGNLFRCHRLLVADALTVRGFKIWHIANPKSKRQHAITKFARVEGTKISYP
jgi:uncharacterized protein (DUF488 family)